MEQLSRIQKLKLIKQSVHSDLDYSRYSSSVVLDSTNCYSHAMGANLPFLELYRIGAICGNKDISDRYVDFDELFMLLRLDLLTLGLTIENSYLGDLCSANQYQIAFFVKVYADGLIHDYHFYRNDSYGWSEKWRGQKPHIMGFFQGKEYFPWQFLGIFKITK